MSCFKSLGPSFVKYVRTTGVALHFDRHIRANTDDYFKLSEKKQNFRRREAFYGMELVADVQRLALMNARLHDIEGDILLGDTLGPSGAKLPKRSWAGLSVSVKALCQVEVFAGSSPARSRRSSGQYTSRRS